MSSRSSYVLDPAAPAILVESVYSMTNTTPNERDGNAIRYFYFSGLDIPIHTGASDIVVEVDGSPAEFTKESEGGYEWLVVEFGRQLRYNRTAEVVVRYRLTGDPPRTERSWVRVNPAYASVPVFVYADDGKADVSVSIPKDWTPDYVGPVLSRRTDGDMVVYEATAIAAPLEFDLMFTARQDELLESKPVTVGDSTFEVRSWPGDDAWAEFAERHIQDGVPVLERLTGTPWPEDDETEVIEASTPYLRGYAGYYYPDTDVIEVAEELDGWTMLHELSHAWFNADTLVERWLIEGLADEIGARALGELGDPLPDPDDYEPPADFDPSNFVLNEWDQQMGDLLEEYGYETSFRVARELADEIGPDKMTALVAAVVAGERAYPGEDGDAIEADEVNWMEFLDLAEQIGGSQQLVELYREHVVTRGQVHKLDARAEALEQYAALVDHGAGWSPPEAVRAAMAAWLFAGAANEIEAATAALDLRDEIDATLDEIDLATPNAIEREYEAAEDLDPVAAALDEHLAEARRLVNARAELTAVLAELDLDVPPLDQAGYESASLEVAGETELLADQADDLRRRQARLHETLATYALEVPDLDADAFVESPAAVLELVDVRQTAADAVVAAHDRRAEGVSLIERIGRIGSDADTRLAAADEGLAEGDTVAAELEAAATFAEIDDWNDRGRTRLAIAGSILAAGLLAMLVVVIVKRRRRARREADDPAGEADEAGDDADSVPGARQTGDDERSSQLDGLLGTSSVGIGSVEHGLAVDGSAGDAADPADAGQVVTVDPDR